MGLLDGFKKLKRYIANEHGDYQLVSLWTHASTVVMDGDVSLKDSLDSKVNKTGDTLTGGLTINSATGSGNIVLKDTGFALDTSVDNGVPQDEPRFKLLGAYDKNGRRFGVFQFAARDDGGTDVAMVATNMKTDGETWAGGIWASAEKDGTMNYSITQPAKFKEAIGLTDLGKRYTNFANKSITVADIDTEVEGASLTLPKGSYMIMGQWTFNSLSSMDLKRVTKCKLYNKTTGTDISEQRVSQATGNFCVLQAFGLVTLSAESSVICVRGAATQTSGNGGTSIIAMKIAD